jgi:asparagine N-glycosylation enzyme membrane subunit Stt3
VKRQHLWFCAFALCLVGLCMLLTPADVLAGAQLIDTDAYMRLVRVRLLVESGAWFDASIPRSNWPFGETLHWTRPMDLVLLIGAAPLWPIVGFDQALRWAGLLVPPLLLVATFAATAWAADPIAGRGSRGFVLLVMSTQVIVLSYGQPGRPDHHALILLLFALSLGFLLRGLEKPASVRSAHGLGITAALGMWVSPEFLLPLALFFVGSMGAWVRSGGEAIRFNVGWTRALLIALAACLVIERGAELSAIEYDKISLVHVAVAALALGVWSALARMELGGSVKSVRARAAAGGALGLMSLALMALLFPRFFGGPMVDVTDPVVQSWLHRVAELQPILTPDDARGLGMFLLCAGTTLIAAPYLVASLTRRDVGRRGGRHAGAPDDYAPASSGLNPGSDARSRVGFGRPHLRTAGYRGGHHLGGAPDGADRLRRAMCAGGGGDLPRCRPRLERRAPHHRRPHRSRPRAPLPERASGAGHSVPPKRGRHPRHVRSVRGHGPRGGGGDRTGP